MRCNCARTVTIATHRDVDALCNLAGAELEDFIDVYEVHSNTCLFATEGGAIARAHTHTHRLICLTGSPAARTCGCGQTKSWHGVSAHM